MFGPRWFGALLDEAEHSPAIIAGLFFVWLSVIAASLMGWFTFNAHALAAENRDADIAGMVQAMNKTIAANTRALECARQDRAISAKSRELSTVQRLLEATEDNHERRDLAEQASDLKRQLDTLETKYKNQCL